MSVFTRNKPQLCDLVGCITDAYLMGPVRVEAEFRNIPVRLYRWDKRGSAVNSA